MQTYDTHQSARAIATSLWDKVHSLRGAWRLGAVAAALVLAVSTPSAQTSWNVIVKHTGNDELRLDRISWPGFVNAAGSKTAWMYSAINGRIFDETVQLVQFGCRARYTPYPFPGTPRIDVDYPLHRYFKWSTQIEHELGSAKIHLEALGARIATGEIAAF